MMYESKYKYKHAERRARLFPEKIVYIEPIPPTMDKLDSLRLLGLQAYDRERQLAGFGEPQYQSLHNLSGGLSSVFSGYLAGRQQ